MANNSKCDMQFVSTPHSAKQPRGRGAARALPRCEDRLAFDLARLGRRPEPGDGARKTWRHAGRYVGVSATVTRDCEALAVECYRCDDVGRWLDPPEHSARIPFLTTPTRFGRPRLWLQCPACSRRCRALYFEAGRLCCRLCAGIRYKSQNMRPRNRWERRRAQIRRSLADETDAAGVPPRPKGMRRGTYNRLAAIEDDLSNRIARDILGHFAAALRG
jgi:hypothetical protein